MSSRDPKGRAPDELVGVVALEMGHLVHHEGTRPVMEAGGLSFLFGVVLEDFAANDVCLEPRGSTR